MIRHIIIFLTSSISGLALFAYLLFSQLDYLPALQGHVWIYAGATGISVFLGWLTHVMRENLLHKMLPWGTHMLLRFVSQVLLLLVFLVSTTLLMVWLFAGSIFSVFYVGNIDTFEVMARFLILVFLVVFIYTLVDLALCSYHSYAVEQVKSIRQKRTQLELQHKALVSQLSPHYLFNNLNTVYALIHSNVDMAENYIRMLTQTHQYILATHHKKLVTLKEEVDFVQKYFQMLAIRFDKTIQLKLDIHPHGDLSFIPPMSLQILLENACKHNTFSKQQPLTIHIYTEKKNVIVSNNLNPVAAKTDSFQIGLGNIQNRYAQFTNSRVSWHKNDKFIVILPMLSQGVENFDVSETVK